MKTYDRPWTSIVLTQPVAYFYKLRSQLGVKYFNKLLKFRTIYRQREGYYTWTMYMYNITFLRGEGWGESFLDWAQQKFSPFLYQPAQCWLAWWGAEATKNVFDIQFISDFISPAQLWLLRNDIDEYWWELWPDTRYRVIMASQTSRDDQWPGHGTRCGSLPSDNH